MDQENNILINTKLNNTNINKDFRDNLEKLNKSNNINNNLNQHNSNLENIKDVILHNNLDFYNNIPYTLSRIKDFQNNINISPKRSKILNMSELKKKQVYSNKHNNQSNLDDSLDYEGKFDYKKKSSCNNSFNNYNNSDSINESSESNELEELDNNFYIQDYTDYNNYDNFAKNNIINSNNSKDISLNTNKIVTNKFSSIANLNKNNYLLDINSNYNNDVIISEQKFNDLISDESSINRIKEIMGYLRAQKQPFNNEDLDYVFDRLDINKDSKITIFEIKKFFNSLRTPINEYYLNKIIEEFDDNKNGVIDKEEFYKKMNNQSDKINENYLTELLEVFKLFDANHDDQICYQDLLNVFKSLGESFNEQQCKEMINCLCVGNRLDFPLFFELIKNEGNR